MAHSTLQLVLRHAGAIVAGIVDVDHDRLGVRVRADRAILPWDDHEWSTSVADEETRTLGRELWGHTRGLTLDWPHHALPDRYAPNEAHEWLLLIASDTPFSRELLRCDDACDETPPPARQPGPRFFLHLFPYRLTR